MVLTDRFISAEEMAKQRNIMAAVARQQATLPRPPRAYIETYGCQQNENDSEKICGMLAAMGYEICRDAALADLIILNTCAIREHAEQRVFGHLGAFAQYKRQNPSILLGVCGCMAQQQGICEQLRKSYPQVDFVFGPHTLWRFPQTLQHALLRGRRVFDVLESEGAVAEGLPARRDARHLANVTIMTGCNNFCSYCVVPYVRGRERSRLPEQVVAEVQSLINDGVKDLTLLGQNVNSYGNDLSLGVDFADLLQMVDAIDGEYRIRFMTSHPKDATQKLFISMAECSHVPHHLHLPFQAGDDRVLNLMNRRYTAAQYLDLVDKARCVMPDLSLTSDVIVGFPTETEEEFQRTLELIRAVRFESLFTFLYSPRPGTPAAKMDGQIPKEVKQRRFEQLLAVQNEISLQRNLAEQGKTLRVLCDGPSKTDPTMLSGRTDRNKVVHFSGDPSLTGSFVPVTITGVKTWSMMGEIAR